MIDIDDLEVWFVRTQLVAVKDICRNLLGYNEEKGPILYRAHCENRGEGLDPRVWFSSYPIVAYTACGVWIGQGVQRKKFVNMRAERQWATVTKEAAMYHLKRRKSRQLEILSWKYDVCQKINHYLNT